MKVHFKSGRTLDISYEIAERLSTKLLKGYKGYQVFTNSMDIIVCTINLNEVEYIS